MHLINRKRSGKTFLSSTVIEKTKSLGRTIFAFLSYTLSSSTSALSITHSLIFQLTSNDDNLQAVLCQLGRENLKSNINAATSFLTTLIDCAGPVYIIIDGLDEIDEIERSKLMRQLLDLSKNCLEIKILVSGRPEADITATLHDKAVTIRVDKRNAGSIQAFVNWHTHKWFLDRAFLPEAQAEIERLLAPLASNSKGILYYTVANLRTLTQRGMFLYAKVVLSSVEYLGMREIRNELEVLPETLDDA